MVGVLLTISPVACGDADSSGTGELAQQFVLKGALSALGGRIPVELGSRFPVLGVCTSLKRGLSPKWDWLGLDYSLFNPV